MTIEFKCQSCGKTISVPRESAGSFSPCPHCFQTVGVPERPPALPQEPPPLPNVQGTNVTRQKRNPIAWPRISITDGSKAILLVVFFAWINVDHDSRASGWLCYLYLVAIGGAIYGVLRHKRRRWLWIAIGIWLFVFAHHAWNDTYADRWVKNGVVYTDTRGQFSNRHLLRHLIVYDEHDKPSHPALRRRIFESAGPMAPSGNPHGMWVDTAYDNSEALDLVGNSRTVFYWYGDEVSEGEWHLRNK